MIFFWSARVKEAGTCPFWGIHHRLEPPDRMAGFCLLPDAPFSAWLCRVGGRGGGPTGTAGPQSWIGHKRPFYVSVKT